MTAAGRRQLLNAMQHYLPCYTRYGLSVLLFLLLFPTACRDAPEPPPDRSKMFADFFVRYLATERQLRGQASFWDGLSWTNLDPITPEGVVSFEGRKMEPRRLPGNEVRFSDTSRSDYAESLAFRFRSTDGRYLQYELKMTPVRDFFVKGKISKSAGASLVINGGVMSKGESLVFLFTNADNEATALTVEGPNTDVTVQLAPAQLQNLTTGPGRLYLVKKQHKTEVHPNLELTSAVEYYTESREVVVEE